MPEEMFCWHCVYWFDTHCFMGKVPTACGAYFTPRRPKPFEPEYFLDVSAAPAEMQPSEEAQPAAVTTTTD